MSVFFLLLWAQFSLAETGSLFGLGPKSSGMGATSLLQGSPSAFQSFSAPASLGFMRSVEVSAGGLYFDPRINPFGVLVIDSNGTQGGFPSAGVLPGGGSNLAFAFPIGKERPLTVGAALFMPFSTLIRVSSNAVNFPFYPLYNDISRNFFFVVGAGFEIFDGFSLGVNMRSTTKSSTYYVLQSDNTINYSATATEAKSESHLSFSFVYDEARRQGFPFSLGAMYRAPAGLETKVAADITAFVPVKGELVSLPSYTPAEWVVMGTIKPVAPLTLSADFSWVRWSKFSSPYGTGNINSYAIGDKQKAANFKDIPVAKLGGQYELLLERDHLKKIQFRAGAIYHPSPVPDQTEDSNFVDNDRRGATAGLGTSWKNPWKEGDFIDFDVFAQCNWLKSRTVRKRLTTNVGAPGYTSGGKIFLYGAGLTMKF